MSAPRVCATCGKRLIAWLTTIEDERDGKVFCLDHFTYGGMWADSLKEGALEAEESVQGPDTAPEGANGSTDAPSTGCGKTMTVTEFAYATGLPIWKANPLEGGEA